MPKILDRLVKQLMDKGHTMAQAKSIATKSLQKSGNLKPGSVEATQKGIERGNMTPEERALDRAAKYGGGHPDDYYYDYTSNSTRKR